MLIAFIIYSAIISPLSYDTIGKTELLHGIINITFNKKKMLATKKYFIIVL